MRSSARYEEWNGWKSLNRRPAVHGERRHLAGALTRRRAHGKREAARRFGAYPEGSFSLVGSHLSHARHSASFWQHLAAAGCTCGPAFEFEHFELGDASLWGPLGAQPKFRLEPCARLEKYPEAEEQIKRLL